MCSMIPPITTRVAVANGVDVDLHGLIEETIEQYRRVVGHLHSVMHVALEFVVVVDDLHGAPAEHIGRTHHDGIAVLGAIDGVRRCSDDGHARREQRSTSFSGVCPPNCTITPVGCSSSTMASTSSSVTGSK